MNDLWDRFWAHLETLFEETDITVGQPLDNAGQRHSSPARYL